MTLNPPILVTTPFVTVPVGTSRVSKTWSTSVSARNGLKASLFEAVTLRYLPANWRAVAALPVTARQEAWSSCTYATSLMRTTPSDVPCSATDPVAPTLRTIRRSSLYGTSVLRTVPLTCTEPALSSAWRGRGPGLGGRGGGGGGFAGGGPRGGGGGRGGAGRRRRRGRGGRCGRR